MHKKSGQNSQKPGLRWAGAAVKAVRVVRVCGTHWRCRVSRQSPALDHPTAVVTAVGRRCRQGSSRCPGLRNALAVPRLSAIARSGPPYGGGYRGGPALPSWCVGACPRLANNSAAAGRCRNDPLWTTLPRKLPAIRGLPRTRRAPLDRRGSRFPLSAFPFPLFPETPARAASTAGG
jgi:hypothetical protein